MSRDFPATYTTATPLVATALSFGNIAPDTYPGLVGGGIDYFEVSGPHTAAQVIRIRSGTGGAPPPDLRLAVVRVQ